MLRLSINELTTYRWTFDEDVARYAAEGFKAIGVSRDKLNDFGEEKGCELLREHGLEVSNLHFAGGFTGCDGRSLAESVDDAVHAIRLCADLKSHCLLIYTGGRSLHTHSHARRLVKDALQQLIPQAEEHDVTLAVEPMRADCSSDCTFLHTHDDALNLVQAIDHPLVKLALDTYHLGLDGQFEEHIEALAPYTGIVQIGDGRAPRSGEQDRCILGRGDVPLAGIVRAFLAAGYQGYFDLELMGVDIEMADYMDVIRCSKQWFETVTSVEGAAEGKL